MSEKECKTIFKIHNGSFTVVPNELVNNPELSLKAKGIMLYLLSKPDGWRVRVNDIMKHCKDGRDSIYSGLSELKKNGYLVLHQERNSKGQIVAFIYHVYNTPQGIEKPVTEKPEKVQKVEKPEMVKPYTENPKEDTLYNEYNNKENSKKDSRGKTSDPTDEKLYQTIPNSENKITELPKPEYDRRDEKFEYCENVFLSINELIKLSEEYGEDYSDSIIDKMSNWKTANNKQYTSDYHALRSWIANDRGRYGYNQSHR